jgi:hypothetical protein
MKQKLLMTALQIVDRLPANSDVGRVNEILQNLINASVCISQAIEYPALGSIASPLAVEDIGRDADEHSVTDEPDAESTSPTKRKK